MTIHVSAIANKTGYSVRIERNGTELADFNLSTDEATHLRKVLSNHLPNSAVSHFANASPITNQIFVDNYSRVVRLHRGQVIELFNNIKASELDDFAAFLAENISKLNYMTQITLERFKAIRNIDSVFFDKMLVQVKGRAKQKIEDFVNPKV